jgi:O-antigen/teichoic acid export membrane protein
MSSLAQRVGRNPLPEGTLAVGAGLVLAGVAQYGFLAVSARALGSAHYAPLATFWALLFVCGPGFFLPLEQEVGRALSARRALGQGGRPLVIRAAVAGGGLAIVLILATALASGPIDTRLFNGDGVMLWAFIAGLVAYCIEHLARGTLAGNGRFRPYGLLIGTEGVLRVVLCTLLAVAGAKVAGLFGFSLVIASYGAVAIALAGRRGLLRAGPPASWRELSRALGFLLVSSVLTQFLLSIGTVAVQLLAPASQQAAAGRFLTSRILAYIPIFLLQAVQAPLLPKLSALAASGNHREFRKVLIELLLFVSVLGGLATVGFAAFGPLASSLLFGGGFELGHLDYALLAASCAAFMVAQVLNQAIVSLSGYPRATAGWVTGAAAFVVVTLLGSQLFLRVELGLLVGSVATVAVMSVLLVPLLRSHVRAVEANELFVAVPPAEV